MVDQYIVLNGYAYESLQQIDAIDDDTLRMSANGRTYYLAYRFDGTYLTIHLESGAVGNNYSETEVWKRVEAFRSSVGIASKCDAAPPRAEIGNATNNIIGAMVGATMENE